MRVLLQRVRRASVTVADETVGAIGHGILLFLGVTHGDTRADADWLAKKAAGLRIFEDDEGKMNKSLLDIGGDALVVSQFTLYADCRKGNRPSFIAAARPEKAEPLYDYFNALLREQYGLRVETGRFGADMQVDFVNDGPVTIIYDNV